MHPFLPDLLHCGLGRLSPAAQAVVTAIVTAGGAFVSSSALARKVGLRDRYALDRLLQNEGLPTYKQFSGWIRVLGWVLDWEKNGVALSSSALRSGKNAGIYARTVRRVTGLSWTEVRQRGSTWVLLELIHRCRLDTHPARSTPTAAPASLAC
jgi:hypothetical protein